MKFKVGDMVMVSWHNSELAIITEVRNKTPAGSTLSDYRLMFIDSFDEDHFSDESYLKEI